MSITCDRFNAEHKTISFKPGLNTVLGSSDGSNAIGKSTLLLIVDFAFGGDSYVKMAKDVVGHMGNHTVKFSFKFGKTDYFFARSTSDDDRVRQYDAEYKHEIKSRKIDEYRGFLRDEYGITARFVGLKAITERFFRISGRENANVHEPLYVPKNREQVETVMKLLGKYETLDDVKREAERLDMDIAKVLSFSPKMDIGATIEAAEGEKASLQGRYDEVRREHINVQLRQVGYDEKTAERLENLQDELRTLGRKRNALISQRTVIKKNAAKDGRKIETDFSPLLRFFPSANIADFEEVERFHASIGQYLAEGIQKELERIEPLIASYDRQIERLKEQLANSDTIQRDIDSTLHQCISIEVTIRAIDAKLKDLERQRELQNARIEAERILKELLYAQTTAINEAEKAVNERIAVVNAEITNGQDKPPVFKIDYADKTARLTTPDNRSDGTSLKNLVVFDLALFAPLFDSAVGKKAALTPIPAIIHDSNILSPIENSYFERILELYEDCGKQVFIAYDKAETCTQTAWTILDRTARVRLSNENVLFLESWSKSGQKKK